LSIYIYYLCWNKKSAGDEVAEQNIADLKEIIAISHNYDENNIHNYIKIYRDNIFEDFSFIKSKLNLSFWKAFSGRSISSTDIQYAMYEFLAFIGQKFYPNYSYSRNLSDFEIDDLLQIYGFFDITNEMLDASLNQEYKEFLSWVGIEESSPSASAFFSDLSSAIFFRLQNKYKNDRNNKVTEFRKNFNEVKVSIQLELNQSPFLIEENDNNVVIQISKNVLLDSFYTEKKTININLEKSIRKEIEENVIEINKKCFKDINISLIDKSKQKSISRILQKLKVMGKNRINIDKYLNHLISDKEWIFIKDNNEKIQKFIDFEGNLQKRGELIHQNYPIYFDSTKMNIGFTLVDIMFIDQIDNTDIRNILSKLPKDGNSVEMNIAGQKYYLDKESAFEYIKSAYCKIMVKVKIQKSEEKCGLILKPKLLTKDIIST
jgi:hypothetical protein